MNEKHSRNILYLNGVYARNFLYEKKKHSINLYYSFIKPKPYGHLIIFIFCRNNKSLVFKMVIDKCLKRMQLNSYKYFSRKQCFIRIDSINWILEFVHFMLYPFSEIVPNFGLPSGWILGYLHCDMHIPSLFVHDYRQVLT